MKMSIKRSYLVEKRNILNEVRSNSMSLPELRFFSIYLAKINARDVSTRAVRFSLEEFQKIMELCKLNLAYLQEAADNLLGKVVGVPLENGGFERFQLFKKAEFSKDEDDEWYIEIDAHDQSLPLMFEFKERYFTYELWNALKLKSSNQLRMYEILKQYEKVGERIFSLVELKELLGLKATDYPRYDNFRVRVLNSCQEALATYTDIKFIYAPFGKLGKGGKVNKIKFTISHNEDYVDQLSLDDFIDLQEVLDDGMIETVFKNERLAFLAEACKKEFKEVEVQVLHDLLVAIHPYTGNKYKYEVELYNYLKLRYDELNIQAERKVIKSRFGYLKKMLESDLEEKDDK